MIAQICSYIIALSVLLCGFRLFRGPKLSDRVVAADLIGILILALITLYVHFNDETVYLDVAIVLALIAFLGTVIFARFLEKSNHLKKEVKK
jgi:multicomponent Na+:H+ antiporter subunit F